MYTVFLNYPLPSVSPNIIFFFFFSIESELCIICPKYFNLLILAKISREYLGIIWLVTDTSVLIAHGIISFSFIVFPLHQYSTAGKTVFYSGLTFVLVKTSKSFMIFLKFAVDVLLKLILFLVSLLVYLSLVMRTTKNLWFVTVLLSSPSEKVFTFSTLLITVVFCRFKFRPTLSLLILSVQSCHPCFQLVEWYHLRVLLCLFFISPFQYLFPYHLLLPSL